MTTPLRIEMDAHSANLYMGDFVTASRVAEALYDMLSPVFPDTFTVIDVNEEWESYNMPQPPDEPQVMLLFTEPPTIEEMAHLLKSLVVLFDELRVDGKIQ